MTAPDCAWSAPGALVRSVRTTAPVRPALRGRTARRTRTALEKKLRRTTEPGALDRTAISWTKGGSRHLPGGVRVAP
jgi:hypothetical protein